MVFKTIILLVGVANLAHGRPQLPGMPDLRELLSRGPPKLGADIPTLLKSLKPSDESSGGLPDKNKIPSILGAAGAGSGGPPDFASMLKSIGQNGGSNAGIQLPSGSDQTISESDATDIDSKKKTDDEKKTEDSKKGEDKANKRFSRKHANKNQKSQLKKIIRA